MVVANADNRQVGLVVEEVLGKDGVIKSLEYLRRIKLFRYHHRAGWQLILLPI
jgi:hypothetical protein